MLQSIFLNSFMSIIQRKSIIFLSVILPSVLHILLFPLTVWFLSATFFDHTYRFAILLNDTIAEDAYKYLLIYGTVTLLYVYKQSQLAKPEILPAPFSQKIIINTGRTYITLDVNEILFIRSSAPYIALFTENKKYLQAESLKSINKKLDRNQFIRVHKSTIINVNKVISYKSRLNGDYDILLESKEIIRLSRNYASAFKERMR
jgi:DNA-binding LytR/AlgR family response regulator